MERMLDFSLPKLLTVLRCESVFAGPTGEIMESADDKSDTVLVAKFDLNQLKVKRSSWGVFRDRRPELYKVLLTLDGQMKPNTI